jgi:hypothetical protein
LNILPDWLEYLVGDIYGKPPLLRERGAAARIMRVTAVSMRTIMEKRTSSSAAESASYQISSDIL